MIAAPPPGAPVAQTRKRGETVAAQKPDAIIVVQHADNSGMFHVTVYAAKAKAWFESGEYQQRTSVYGKERAEDMALAMTESLNATVINLH